MRRLSNSGAMSEARRFKTLMLGRSIGSGAGAVALPQATAQNQMLITSAAPAWTLLAAPTAEGQVPITGADPYTPAWTALTVSAISDLVFAAPASPSVSLAASAEGTGTSFVRDDHSHQLDQAITPTWTGLHTFAAHMALSAALTLIRTDTADGSDTKGVALCGGGDFLPDRGGRIWLSGNEYTGEEGAVTLTAGNVSGGNIELWTGAGARRMQVTHDGVIVLTVADNTASAFTLRDAGGLEYLRIISTDAQPVVVFNEGGADVDHRWEASGEENALFIQGSDGYVALGHDSPERMLHIKSDTVNSSNIILEEYLNTTSSPDVFQRKGRGTIASPLDVHVGDSLGAWHFSGYRNSDWRSAAQIFSRVAALDTSIVRGELVLQTTNASGTLVDNLIIDEDGNVHILENSATVRLSGTFALHFVIPEPIVETMGQLRIPWACTVTRVDAATVGGTSCTLNIEERGTLGSAGTDVLSSDMAADANGESVTSSFNNSSLAEGNHLAYDVSAVSGAVDEVSITITGTID